MKQEHPQEGPKTLSFFILKRDQSVVFLWTSRAGRIPEFLRRGINKNHSVK